MTFYGKKSIEKMQNFQKSPSNKCAKIYNSIL